ncbi:hypothetical protein MCP_1602 [Methanocella paludicola SANAE]|uniref:ATP-dependent helicase n=1 Tax=Methanocella paludicola (strain DSM 17711 / JCM 13418 / NBRC 101707 / SANAE) TaxID=304371 RepID=D1YZ02_METPS|nr:DEAD/DEAH box helicase [Methanocella paludicola]BAI61674.1 hypothetical protein MCP_1602 [Methanocella paludicola SANAE]
MVDVYYSHIMDDSLKSIKNPEIYNVDGKIIDLLKMINSKHPGFSNSIIDTNNKIHSRVRVYKNIIFEDGRIADSDKTVYVNDINDNISNTDNILFSIFDAEKFKELINQTLLKSDQKFTYRSVKSQGISKKDYNIFIDDVKGPIKESIKKFKNGDCTLKDLKVSDGQHINIRLKESEDPFDRFDRKGSKLLPSPIISAISKIWGFNEEDSRLYLHQEDSLFFILSKLEKPQDINKSCLLLSIPTGGGKTEAFLIPIIAHIYDDKLKDITSGYEPLSKVRAIITYPTKALANDQANRIVEILNEINRQAIPHQQITLGILTGDTPNPQKLYKDNPIQLCPECKESNFEYIISDSENGKKLYTMKCSHCGLEIRFVRLTREDIITSPPDILISNLDMINVCLQSPKYRNIFEQKIDLMVFDEFHLCESIYGCHAGHLLRRLEEASGNKPLYIGVSATIKNAEEIASLVFNVDKKDILFLSDKNRSYLINDENNRYRYHYAIVPYNYKENRFMQVVTTTLNTVEVLGHSINDPHFRKTIVFTNYRHDTDSLVRNLKGNETKYFRTYKEDVFPKIESDVPLDKSDERVGRYVGKWYDYLKQNGMLNDAILEIGWHRGGLEPEERIKSITKFTTSKTTNWRGREQLSPIDIMMATKTLELGIDIGDVSNVFNSSAPFTVNEYVQRIGRGGRKKDSIAVTVIDPTNAMDYYFLNEFENFAKPEKRVYEDAPILISNQSIVDIHLTARILDFIASELRSRSISDRPIITIENIKKIKISYKGEQIDLVNNPKIFAEVILDSTINKIISISDETKTKSITSYMEWFDREQKILNTNKYNASVEQIKKVIIDKCVEIADKINRGIVKDQDIISGPGSKISDLVPNMRGAGYTCHMMLITGKEDAIKDAIGRIQVLSHHPLGGFATQGANSYKIDSLERDPIIELKIKRLLNINAKAFDFYKKQFGESFPEDAIALDVQTPLNIKVRYYPYRFYCPKCGRTYLKPTDEGNRCINCHTELAQISEVYRCRNCGEIYEPPVPRVCMNPAHIRRETEFMQSMKSEAKYDKFAFRSLPGLYWQCKECKKVFNYHDKNGIDLPKEFMRKKFDKNLDFDIPEDVAKLYQYRPEAKLINRTEYLSNGYNLPRYTCGKCENKRFDSVTAVDLPNTRTVLLEYLIYKDELMSPETAKFGSVDFKSVDVISLGREYVTRFISSNGYELKIYDIFPKDIGQYSYMGNVFSTHSIGIKFLPGLLDEFISTQHFCINGSCSNCENIVKLDSAEMTRPTLDLKDWERQKKPDIRRKWCETIKGIVCDNADCTSCAKFDREAYLRYLLLHTIKHGIILSMPKYTGINKNEVRGIIYPNDESSPELAFLDSHESGSGSIYLAKRNWEQIWELSKELIQNARDNEGTLLLPNFCSRYNADLCPFLAAEFYKFLDKRR